MGGRGVVFLLKNEGKWKGVGGWGGGGTGKGTGKSMRKLCRNHPLASHPLVSPRDVLEHRFRATVNTGPETGPAQKNRGKKKNNHEIRGESLFLGIFSYFLGTICFAVFRANGPKPIF